MLCDSDGLRQLSSAFFVFIKLSFVNAVELSSGCPFADAWSSLSTDSRLSSTQFSYAGEPINYDAVVADIKNVLNSSRAFWPADFGYYVPLMIRLA